MATMKDVAKRAGVSVATISNYLNGTKNVGSAKKLSIEKAIKDLNYILDPNAQQLKKKDNNKIGIIFPYMNGFYDSIYEGLLKTTLVNNYKIELIITKDDMEIENASIQRLIREKVAGLAIATCQPQNKRVFEELSNRNIPFVLIEREVYGSNFNYVGFDNYDTVYSIVKKILVETSNIALAVGPEGYRTEDDCVRAFADAVSEKGFSFSNDRIIRTKNSRGNSFYNAIKFLERFDDNLEYIIASNKSIGKGLKSAIESNMTRTQCKIVCLGEDIDEVFNCSEGVYSTPRSPYSLGVEGGNILYKHIKSESEYEIEQLNIRDSINLIHYFIDFVIKDKQMNLKLNSEKIRVLILDDPLSGGLKSLIPQFQRLTGIKVEVESCIMNNYYDFLCKQLNEESSPDLFLIDVPWIEYFASKGLISSLEDCMKNDNIYRNTFVPKLLKAFGQFESTLYALPYSYTNQLLFYRKDLFENVELKKSFEESYGFPLRPPKNWVEFNAVARFFTKKYNPLSPVDYGTSLAVAYPQAVAPEFLLRLWSLGGDIFDSKGNITIDNNISKKAVKNYCECFNYATPNAFINMPSDQVREFCEGKAAMIVSFFSYGSEMIHGSDFISEDKLGFSIVPGKISVLSGWSMCINANSQSKEAAYNFLKWLCGPEVAIKRAFLEGQSSQEYVYQSTELMKFYPWISTALQSLEFSSKRYMPRINGIYPEPEKAIEDLLGNMIYDILKQPNCFEELMKTYRNRLEKLIFSVTR